ncbi:hypothetical protein NDU88_001932 [Pleurodeles waltl]|uniref:Uncharacterized protein n=1 Tax=Pleurodeles waltl TaxID=8319 RepID=A0AAV7LZ20_PLEWA|nr:hypothetical protein NDU88_001932 [Pleurodeles waltl]
MLEGTLKNVWPGGRTTKKTEEAGPCLEWCARLPSGTSVPAEPWCPMGPCRGLDGVHAAREETKAASPPVLDQTQRPHPGGPATPRGELCAFKHTRGHPISEAM